jgi:hypothetical protein
LEVWAGVLPLKLIAEEPIKDPRLKTGIEPAPRLFKYSRQSD